MSEPLRMVPPNGIVVGWDFSTGAVKAIAFDLQGTVVAEVRLPTDLWTEGGVTELNLMQLEGQARASTRSLAAALRDCGRLNDWLAGGISATHHTAGRLDANNNQVRRAICWNDQSLAEFHALGQHRLGGPEKVRELIGGPWAVRYSLSHLVKDEKTLPAEAWKKTRWILPHGPLAAGYLTGRFDVISVSSAASTGIMDFRTDAWSRAMLGSLENQEYRESAWRSLSMIVPGDTPIGPISLSIALDAGIPGCRPAIFPTLDDQAAGLVGGGAVEDGQVAVILGNSAVVNSSSNQMPLSGNLDVMKLNWGPYLWMRCYSNGAQFLDRVVGPRPDWDALEQAARVVPPGCNGVSVLPFILSEPSVGITKPRVEWSPAEPKEPGVRFRAALEALAYLIALGVSEHATAGQVIRRITVSGGIARSNLMGAILASVLERPFERLISNEGPALGAAVTALAGLEASRRKQENMSEPFLVTDAVAAMVRFREPVMPIGEWLTSYRAGLAAFEAKMKD